MKTKTRRTFIKNSLVAAGGILTVPSILQGENRTSSANKRPFIGVQLHKPAFENRSLDDLFTEMRDFAAINTVIYFFKDEDAKTGQNYHGNTSYRRKSAEIDVRGNDTLDLMYKAASKHEIDIYMGGGEMYWASCLNNHASACQIDCYDKPFNFACVNKPEWRKFQMSLHNDLFAQHPYLAGFLFMHERNGSFMPIFKPDTWRGNYNPACFCEDCIKIAEQKGIDAEKARAGFKKLVRLLRDKESSLVRDGIMVSMWRIISEYPEVMAWEKLQWDSFQDYRKDIVKAIKQVKPTAKIGYHFQHHGLYGALPWRAGDNPEYAVEFADWVKPSVYPGASGARYKDLLDKARKSYLGDLDELTAHRTLSGWFNRSAENGMEMLGDNLAVQSAFSAEWVESEVQRIVAGSSPLPVYAGLGIGVPGGEQIETPEFIAECTKACFKGGANGIILSRHYSEMKPALVKAAGGVIKNHFKIS